MLWATDSIFYQIFPLGVCAAPLHNDFVSPPINRLQTLYEWLEHFASLGANALYLGPVFESSSHGYDTADYFQVDRRLGKHEHLVQFVDACHQKNVKVVLDGVFNHVGRDFWAFKDLQTHGYNSAYKDWFSGLRFDRSSPYGDAFSYETWSGHYSLVKLNLNHPPVVEHFFQAVEMWINQYHIDGIRIDAADSIAIEFQQKLAAFCRNLRPDFWLMGEVVHGDYRHWANPEILDSVTNYECYKGLYSSLNDKNYYEIAYALNRQFGENGIYRHIALYNFVDNHDVERLASRLLDPNQLELTYVLLFSMPGIPSLYYGSEFGILGKKNNNDLELRPALDLPALVADNANQALLSHIRKLSMLRNKHAALRHGNYRQVYVSHEQLAFMREYEEEKMLVVLNASAAPCKMDLNLGEFDGLTFIDVLHDCERWSVHNQHLSISIRANGACILTNCP